MVGSIAIAIAIDIYGTDHSKTEHPNTELENVRFSNGFGFRMVGIRALTVCDFCSANYQREIQPTRSLVAH